MRLTPLYILRTRFSSVCLLLVLPLLGHAQEATALQTALSRCYALASAIDRVDCYDALARSQEVSAAPSATQTAAVPAIPAEPPPTRTAAPAVLAPPAAPPAASSAAAPAAEFGQQAKVEGSNEGEAELTDTVSAVKRVEPAKLQITLTSGQVWRQSVGKNFLIREGETVNIRASGWGNDYRLSVDGRSGYIQVSRQHTEP